MKTKLPPPVSSLPAGERLVLPHGLRAVLGQVRRRLVLFTLFTGLARIFAVLAVLWLTQGLADWLFGLPRIVRGAFLLADAGVVGWLAWKHILRPLSLPLGAEAMALLIERRMPQFRSELISAVQLAAGGPGCIQGSVELVRRLIARIANKISLLDVPRRVVPRKEFVKAVKILAVVLVIAGGAFAGFFPQSFVLLQRLLLMHVPLPTQTRVVEGSGHLEVIEGADANLSARAAGVLPKSGRLIVAFDDGRRDAVTVSSDGNGVYAFTLPNVRQPFTYHFEIGDGVSEAGRVTVKVVPAITETRFTQVYPDYTGLKETPLSAGTLSLLAGGKLRLEGAANQPIKAARLSLQGPAGDMTAEVFGDDRRSFRAEIPVSSTELTGLSVVVENENGEVSLPVVTRIDVRTDRPPVVSLVAPRNEKLTAQANAVIPIVYTVKDDLGVSQVEIAYEVFRPTTKDQGELPPEKGFVPLPVPPAGSSAPQRFSWDLARLVPPLTIGSTVRFSIEAKDTNTFSGPGVAQSRPRVMRIVSDEEKRLELLEAFGNTARKVESLIKTQQKINESTGSAVKPNRQP